MFLDLDENLRKAEGSSAATRWERLLYYAGVLAVSALLFGLLYAVILVAE
jgi:hypothetical protein